MLEYFVEINGLDRLTNGKQSDPVRVPFLPFDVQNPKKYECVVYLNGTVYG